MTAKEMFEELGYKISENDTMYLIYTKREKVMNHTIIIEISFIKYQSIYAVYETNGLMVTIAPQLQSAINQQIRELRWDSWKGLV